MPPQPLLFLQGQRRYVRYGIPRYLRYAHQHHPLLQQLRPLPVPREADPPDDQQRQAPQAAARLRRRYADPRLAVRGGPLQGHRHGGQRRQDRRGVQRGRPQRAPQHLHRQDHHRAAARPPEGRRHQRGPHQARCRPSGPRPPLWHRPHQDQERPGLVSGDPVREGHRPDHRLVPRPRGVDGAHHQRQLSEILRGNVQE